MRHIVLGLFLYVLSSTIALAADVRPSDESLRQLLAVTDAQKLLEGSMTNIDASMEAGIKQALQGKTLTAREQATVDEMRGKIGALIKEDLTWASMEPVLIDIYSRSLTQSEVDGMLAFYRTDAGKAVIAKMPLVMQNTMQAMQKRMSALVPKMIQIQQETLAKIKAEPAS